MPDSRDALRKKDYITGKMLGEEDSRKRRSSIEEGKEIELMRRYRLMNAVLGTCIGDSAIVGRKVVQTDLITILPRPSYFDRPLRSCHLPYLKKETFIYKRSSTVSKGTKLALGDRSKGIWHLRCIEVDDGNLVVLKSSQDSTIIKSYPLPPLRVRIERTGTTDNVFTLPTREAGSAKKLLALDFSDATSCVIHPLSERDFEDFMRVLGEEDNEFQKDGDDEEWRINAINLAHASRHHFFDASSPHTRKKPRLFQPLIDPPRARRSSSPASIPVSPPPATPRTLLERRSQAWSAGGSPARRPSAIQEEEEEATRSPDAGDEISSKSYPAVPPPSPMYASDDPSGTPTPVSRSPVVRGVEVS